jgi:hypothetical protein
MFNINHLFNFLLDILLDIFKFIYKLNDIIRVNVGYNLVLVSEMMRF